ncbi:MAG: hypothetical protein WA906_00085, partial [Pacificimonas sp.]
MNGISSSPGGYAGTGSAPRTWLANISEGLAHLSAQQLILACIALTAGLQLHLVFVQAFNWDEYFFLSHVYALHDGRLETALQSFHTRLFAWLPLLGLGEVAGLRIGRLVMLGCELLTVACIVGIAKTFVSVPAALLAGLAYLSGGFVFQHGFAFRYDPLAAALLMSALYLMFARRLTVPVIVIVAGLCALSFLVTIKSIFFAPAFLGAVLWTCRNAEDRRDYLVRVSAIAVLIPAFAIPAFLLHSLAIADPATIDAPGAIGGAGATVFSKGFFPRLHFMAKQAQIAPFLTVFLCLAPIALMFGKRRISERVTLALLFSPALTFAFYWNSFPYFYAFILPPAAIAGAIVIEGLARRYRSAVVGVCLAANALGLYLVTPKEVQAVQADILTAVHTLFPEPVPYIDFNAMVPSFPKQNFFMSDWGMETYYAGDLEDFAAVFEREPVPLLIAN